ncbi:phytanoyl-CoA dioxygenase family protein [Streptomyces sp. S.PNR 29]|uniref:phytanoyl-CoA dioxygenase family protein n=1 Tax=Streptomyces sp. S.PNR 29 TaxID=2973805 RepID=UPI0025B03A67|nr:phytanoyl-CoA dioxygenase family protein [Streptomyces sp. S.PNR 29]MDN0195311.1 phytanoyl-CoA dioxygenase family protein [Streptomyces sp. S.PNR 29]
MTAAGRDLKERWAADGYAFPVPLLEPQEAGALLTAVRRHKEISHRVGGRLAQRWNSPKIHLLAPWADRLVRDDRLLDVATRLIGPDLLVWSTTVFVRRAGSAERLAWHQDALHYGWANPHGTAVRVWLALTAAGPENGTMRFLPGPHNHALVPHRLRAGRAADGLEADIAVDEESAVEVRLRPGQASLHGPTTVHSSGPSAAAADRVCFAVDYISPALRQLPGADSALLVRGSAAAGTFALEEPPEHEYSAASLRRFQEAVALRDEHFRAVARAAAEAG